MNRTTPLILLLLFNCITTRSQVSLESSRVGTSNDGALVVYGSSSINNNKRIPYERIKGSAFWNDDYLPASLYTASNQLAGKAPVRLNLYTNEVYFKTPAGEEMVITSDKLGKIIFHGADSANPMAVFINGVKGTKEENPHADGSAFVQVLNNGDVQLLKHNIVVLNSGDSAFGTAKRFYFTNQVEYFVSNKYGQTARMRKLSRERVLESLNISTEVEEWIRKSDINFKKEQDVVKFLDYLNSTKK